MNYQKYADKAYTKIKQFGSSIIVTRAGNKKYNPATNEYDETKVQIFGVALQRNYDQKNIDGTTIKVGDIMFMCSLNGKPQSNDEIFFEGRNYTVINVTPLSPDGKTNIFYTIQAR